jgi:hypothetical protein
MLIVSAVLVVARKQVAIATLLVSWRRAFAWLATA